MSNPSTDGKAFSITNAQISFANVVADSCAIPGTCVCFLALVAYGIAACYPRARKHMDRVSFRLLIYTLIFNVLFGITYTATPDSPGVGCTFGAFCVNFFLSFSTFFTTCIAINLQLVVVHHVDGQRMEKYYLIGTFLLSMGINIPPLALHQFGWDEGSSTCWYKNSNPTSRLNWIIGTQSFWIALAATIETICSCVILVFMYLCQKKRKALFPQQRSSDITQEPRYRKATLRIVLYPIVSLMVNYSTVALDLNNVIRGMNSKLDFQLLVLDLFLYGIRTLLYGLLAAGDPSFTTALREILGRNKSRLDKPSTKLNFPTVNCEPPGLPPAVFVHVVQSRLSSELSSSGRERASNVIGERRDANSKQELDVDKTRQDLGNSGQHDQELEFTKIERQL